VILPLALLPFCVIKFVVVTYKTAVEPTGQKSTKGHVADISAGKEVDSALSSLACCCG